MINLTDPRTGAYRGDSIDSGALLVARVVTYARNALFPWSTMPPAARSDRLHRLADTITGSLTEYAAAEGAGTGKPPAEALAEVRAAADVFRFYAGAARTSSTPASGGLIGGHESWVRHEPIGVVAAILPWNYPLLMAAWRAAPALAAGNTVILKPAETTPDTAQLLQRDADDLLGDGVLTALTGRRTTGRLLVDADGVDMVAFTGSERGGYDVAARAGVRRTSLELGGNCPAIILPDHPEDTFERLAAAITYNAGQSCASPARIITLDAPLDSVLLSRELLIARHAGRDFGPLNNPDQVRRFDRLIASTKGQVSRGEVTVRDDEDQGYWRAPVVITDVAEDDPAIAEELFGPAVTVQHAQRHVDALRAANSQRHALAASIWTTDLTKALCLARELNVGEVWINTHLAQCPELPHGGRGASGTGTDLSVLALDEYRRPKTITARLI